MQNSVFKTTLQNGMMVLLKEIHSAPLISHWVWYRVGSRDEVAGITGISHWVEHMLFKGTEKFPSDVMDKAISREGGVWNAFTYTDWTTFFETLPADKIELALKLESDRMSNSIFETEEVASERTVIIAERQGSENEPMFQLTEEMHAAAFRVHPYHHMVIGDLADLETIQRNDLYAHYRKFYSPNNAILAVAGDFETREMLEMISEYYESIPAGEQVERAVRQEPPQMGERTTTVEGAGETTYLQMAFKIPNANHDDFFALMVLDSLLTGPSNLNLFGGGISNKTSRLYQTLIENQLAVSISGNIQATIDPFLYNITAILHPASQVEHLIQAIDQEVNLIKQNKPDPESLEKALKQARALFAYGSESITNQAFWLGLAEMFSTYDWFENYLERLSGVTAEDVQRVAEHYLIPANRVVGQYLPEVASQEQA